MVDYIGSSESLVEAIKEESSSMAGLVKHLKSLILHSKRTEADINKYQELVDQSFKKLTMLALQHDKMLD